MACWGGNSAGQASPQSGQTAVAQISRGSQNGPIYRTLDRFSHSPKRYRVGASAGAAGAAVTASPAAQPALTLTRRILYSTWYSKTFEIRDWPPFFVLGRHRRYVA